MIPSTEAKDNCQPASNRPVGLISRRIIAANDNVLSEFCLRRKKHDRQKTPTMIAALIVGGLGGTISRQTAVAIKHTAARLGFINPAVLHSHQIIPIKMPRCIPDRLIKCSRPVLRNALYVPLSIFALLPNSSASSRPVFWLSNERLPNKA